MGDSIAEQCVKGVGREELLEENLSKNGKYEILNSAIGGFNLPQYLGYYKERGIKTDPDLVLISFCMNDCDVWSFIQLNGKIGILQNHEHSIFIVKLFEMSYLYRYAILSSSRKRRNLISSDKILDA